MLTNQRPKGAVRLYALRFMVYGGPSNAMPVVVPRNETPKAALLSPDACLPVRDRAPYPLPVEIAPRGAAHKASLALSTLLALL